MAHRVSPSFQVPLSLAEVLVGGLGPRDTRAGVILAALDWADGEGCSGRQGSSRVPRVQEVGLRLLACVNVDSGNWMRSGCLSRYACGRTHQQCGGCAGTRPDRHKQGKPAAL